MESASERTGAMDSREPRIETIPRKDEKTVKPTISLDSSVINLPSEGQVQAVTSNIGGEHSAAYPEFMYSSQAQPFYYQDASVEPEYEDPGEYNYEDLALCPSAEPTGPGYENLPNECDVYPPYMSVDELEVGPAVIYNEDPSMMYHGGYGYDPYAHYSPISMLVPAAVNGNSQLYSPQQFSFLAPYYQQPLQPDMPYLGSPTPVSQEWFRSSEGTGSFQSPATSPQPFGDVSGAFGQSNFPMASGMMPPQQKS